MTKLILFPVLLAIILYLLIEAIRKFKPYKSIIIALAFLALSTLILTTIVYIF